MPNRSQLLLVLALSGCSAHGAFQTAGADVGTHDETPAALVTAAVAPLAAAVQATQAQQQTAIAGVSRWIRTLEEQGIIPLTIEVLDGELEPVGGLRVRAVDDNLQRYEAVTDDYGQASISVPTVALSRWDVHNGTAWQRVPRPKIIPHDSGMGLLAVIVLADEGAPPAGSESGSEVKPASHLVSLEQRALAAEARGEFETARRYRAADAHRKR